MISKPWALRVRGVGCDQSRAGAWPCAHVRWLHLSGASVGEQRVRVRPCDVPAHLSGLVMSAFSHVVECVRVCAVFENPQPSTLDLRP
eukprot:195617-Rhodomonas_salina.2